MFRMKEKINPLLEELREKYLTTTDIKIFCGEYCNWIDFSSSNQEIIEENPVKTFHIFTPGKIQSDGTTTMPLL